MKVEAQKKAFSLFIAGVPIRAIARQLGVHRSSVERWSSAGHWQIARARATAEATGFQSLSSIG